MSLLGLIGQTVLLGLAAAVTPSLLGLQVLVVAGDPWRRRALAVAAGGSAAFLLVGALLLFGFAQLPVDSGRQHSTIWIAVRILAGLALVVIAIVLLRPHPRLQGRVEQELRSHMAHASNAVFLGIAFALSIKDVSSFIMMAPALHDIAVADILLIEQVCLVVLFFALALSPVLRRPSGSSSAIGRMRP